MWRNREWAWPYRCAETRSSFDVDVTDTHVTFNKARFNGILPPEVSTALILFKHTKQSDSFLEGLLFVLCYLPNLPCELLGFLFSGWCSRLAGGFWSWSAQWHQAGARSTTSPENPPIWSSSKDYGTSARLSHHPRIFSATSRTPSTSARRSSRSREAWCWRHSSSMSSPSAWRRPESGAGGTPRTGLSRASEASSSSSQGSSPSSQWRGTLTSWPPSSPRPPTSVWDTAWCWASSAGAWRCSGVWWCPSGCVGAVTDGSRGQTRAESRCPVLSAGAVSRTTPNRLRWTSHERRRNRTADQWTRRLKHDLTTQICKIQNF